MTIVPTTGGPKKRGRAVSPRSAARLGAVQAIYQKALSDEPVSVIIEEFVQHRLGREIEGDTYAEPDFDLFRDLVQGAHDRTVEIDDLIRAALPQGWPFDRLETLMRSILRAGAYELLARPDIPTAAAINEYVNVAHAFYGGKEPAFVNGVLDQVAKKARTA